MEVELPKIEQEDPIPDVDSCGSSHMWRNKVAGICLRCAQGCILCISR